jgi:hypothetical protein
VYIPFPTLSIHPHRLPPFYYLLSFRLQAYGFGPNATEVGGVSIPAGASLVYEVELVDFKKSKEVWEMDTPAEKLEAAK